MITKSEPKLYTSKEILDEWGGDLWQDTPSKVSLMAFPSGVFVGIVSADGAQRVGILLDAEDAAVIGAKLFHAAMEAGRG